MQINLTEYSNLSLNKFFTFIIKYIYDNTFISKECDNDITQFNYDNKIFNFTEFEELYYDVNEYYDRKEDEKILKLFRDISINDDVMNITFITMYPVVLKNDLGFSDDPRGADNYNCSLPTLSEYNINNTNEFTFEELCRAAYIIKTKKFDKWYELYNISSDIIVDDDNQLITIDLDFQHGS